MVFLSSPFLLFFDLVLFEWNADKPNLKLNKTKEGSRVRMLMTATGLSKQKFVSSS